MNNLESCKEEIIERGFPELRDVEIFMAYKKIKDAYFEFSRNSRRNYSIEADNSMKEVKRKIIIGGMAHEIAHVYNETRMGSFLSFLDLKLYNKFSWYETWDERRTDMLAVKRGFGEELLAFLKHADKKRKKYKPKDGLTRKELEKILSVQ